MRLDCLVPGLFGPVPVQPAEVPPTPVLSRLLGLADRLSGPERLAGAARPTQGGTADPCRTLFHLFGHATAPDRDCPSAPYGYLAEAPGASLATTSYVLHADPVHLRPDRDRLVLFAGPDFAPDRAEADALVALFNHHFGVEGPRLEAPTPEHWYLLTDKPPDLVTQPLAAVLGRPIAGQLPQGAEARHWARFLNEVQMLFHHSEVNQRREAAGIPSLNGLWLWGGGSLVAPPGQASYERVFSADPLALGLARASGIPTAPLPADLGAVLATAGTTLSASAPTPLPTRTPNQAAPSETRTATPASPAAILIHWTGLWEAVLAADGPAWLASLSALEHWLGGLTLSGAPGSAGPTGGARSVVTKDDTRLVSATGGRGPAQASRGAGFTRAAIPGLRLDLDLYPANGEHYRYRPHHRYRFWRHPIAFRPPPPGTHI